LRWSKQIYNKFILFDKENCFNRSLYIFSYKDFNLINKTFIPDFFNEIYFDDNEISFILCTNKDKDKDLTYMYEKDLNYKFILQKNIKYVI